MHADALELNNTQIGLLSSIVLLSWSISGYVVGRWSDRTGHRKPWLIGTFLMFAVCSFLTGLAGSFAMLFAARFLIACCVVAWYFMLLTLSAAVLRAGAEDLHHRHWYPLSDRFGRKRMIMLFVFLALAAPLAPLYAGGSLPLLIALVFMGSMVLGTVPLFMATVPLESVPGRDVAAATGLVMGLGQVVGGFGGPTIGGYLADQWGLAVPLWIVVGAVLIGTLISTRLTETTPRMAVSH